MNKTKLILITLLFVGLMIKPVNSLAFYGDDEGAVGGQAITSTLDFAVRDNATGAVKNTGSPLFFKTEMLPGETIIVPLNITKEGSAAFKYQIQKEYLIPSTNLCDGLTMEAKLEGTVVYSGALNTFVLPSAVTHSGTIDHWILTLGLPTDSADYRSKTCMFGVNFKAWQTDSDGTWGFTSEKKYSLNVIESANWPMPGDLVINELMWMGSTISTADEWIELRNMTSDEINISGLTLDNAGVGSNDLVIPANSYIAANGFYLISNYSSSHASSALVVNGDWITTDLSLDNGGEQISLVNQLNTIIDRTPVGSWSAGNNVVTNNSMERGAVPGDGTVVSNWHACIDSDCNNTIYWDIEGNDYGTPRDVNRSENDLTTFEINGYPNQPLWTDQQTTIKFVPGVNDGLIITVTPPMLNLQLTISVTPTNFPIFTITPQPKADPPRAETPILFPTITITPTPEPLIMTEPQIILSITPTIYPGIIEITPVVPTPSSDRVDLIPTLTLTPTPTTVIEEVAAEITTTVTTVTPTPQPEADPPRVETIELTPEPTVEITPTPEPTVEITPTPEVVE